MTPTVAVPGAPREAKNAYHICQALSWVAKERRQIQDQLDGLQQIPQLMKALLQCLGNHIPTDDSIRPTIEDKKPTPAKSGSRQVPNSFSPLAFHADAPFYIPGAKTRIPAELVTCEHICDST